MSGTPRNSEPLARSGEPPYDGRLQGRVARIEAILEFLQRDVGELKIDVRELRRDHRSDFRILFGAIFSVALGLAGLMAKGFNWL